jgi:hypothetical protein
LYGNRRNRLNLVALRRIDEAKGIIRQALQVQPTISAMLRKGLGALAADVDRRMADALLQADLPEF